MQIQNPEVGEIARIQAGLTLSEGFPQNLIPNVQPVLDITPYKHQKTDWIKSGGSSATGGTTIVTTDAVKKTWLTGVYYTLIKDATCDVASNNNHLVSTTINGVSVGLIRNSILTLTAQTINIFVEFPKPILLSKNSTVSIGTLTFTVGSMIRSAVLYGYEED